ncbi:hypothetical protein FRC03_002674 [Tulasnella sp. 419]|nr:hypothetical protein FRC03_002674 [Tulasnella sp. 419]
MSKKRNLGMGAHGHETGRPRGENTLARGRRVVTSPDLALVLVRAIVIENDLHLTRALGQGQGRHGGESDTRGKVDPGLVPIAPLVQGQILALVHAQGPIQGSAVIAAAHTLDHTLAARTTVVVAITAQGPARGLDHQRLSSVAGLLYLLKPNPSSLRFPTKSRTMEKHLRTS